MVYVGSYDHHVYAFGAPSSEQTYSVTFAASGLPSGTGWNVTFNGETRSSTSDAIVFHVPNGVYGFNVTAPGGFEASPSSGSVTVHFADMNQQIKFTSATAGGLPVVELAITLTVALAIVILAMVLYVKNR